jgi:hypothetical protein
MAQPLAQPLVQSQARPLDLPLAPRITTLGSPLQEQKVDFVQQGIVRFPQNQSNLRGYTKEITTPIKLHKEEQKYNNHVAQSFNLNFCCLTEPELPKLYRHLNQPPATRLLQLLTPASHEPDSAMLQHTTKCCKFRQTHDAFTKHTWDSTRSIWTGTYLRPPDVIKHNQGTDKALEKSRLVVQA